MTDPVNLNGRRDPRAVAREAWGTRLPDWVEALADEAARTTGKAAAARIGYSDAVVSQVLRMSYQKGDMGKVEASVRGAFMGAVVQCPVLDEIPKDRCLAEQRMPFAATSPIRSRLFRACRSGCPHSRINAAAFASGVNKAGAADVE